MSRSANFHVCALLICVLAGVLGACVADSDPAAGAGVVCDDSTLGATRCTGTDLQACDGQRFRTVSRCSDYALVCGELQAAGAVHGCMAGDGAGGDGGGDACDVTGHQSASVQAFFDPDLRAFAEIVSFDAPDVTLADQILQIDNYWPDYQGAVEPGEQATVDLGGVNANYQTCGLCVLAFRGFDEIYLAESGEATVTAPAAPGDLFSVALSGVRLREVNGDGSTKVGGQQWCIDSLFLSSSARRWPCALVGGFVEGQTLCSADATAGAYLIVSCTADGIELTADCTAASLQCDPVDNPAAACK